MKKILFIVAVVFALTACTSTNPNVVPVKYGYGIPTVKFETDTVGTKISMEDEAFIDADINAVADSFIHKGYTFQYGDFSFWIGPRKDSTGHLGVGGKAKMSVYISKNK